MITASSRRSALAGSLAGAATMTFSGLVSTVKAQDRHTVRAVMHAALGALDPFARPNYITRNHGYLVYDTLFALDGRNEPQPQMVGSWTVSPDGVSYLFTLRPGLFFHDGAPVQAVDVVASLRRWMPRDTMGRRLLSILAGLDAVDDASFRLQLRRPYALMLETLAKPSAPVPFIVPRRLAELPDGAVITDPTGSGPFRFNTAAHRPGDRVVYDRFDGYQPRPEPASGLAGGKHARMDRVEWLEITDPQTAVNALLADEVQVMENVPPDSMALVDRSRGVRLKPRRFGNTLMLRFNSAEAPFNDPMVRRAVMASVSQADYLHAQIGDAWIGDRPVAQTCPSILSCDSPWASELPGLAADPDRGRALLAASAYAGQQAVILHPADLPQLATLAPLTEHLLRSIGINTRLDAMDWQTMLARALRQGPVSSGGWSVLPLVISNLDLMSPVTNPNLDGSGSRGFFGWADDPELERLRDAFAFAADAERQQAIATELQVRSNEQAFSIPLGGHLVVTGHRDTLRGVVADQVLVFWNMSWA